MNHHQKMILEWFSKRDYALNPNLLYEVINQEPYILRRNVLYLVKNGFLEHKGYQTIMNKLFPLYQITEAGKERFKKNSLNLEC